MTDETKECIFCHEDKSVTKFLFKYDSKTKKSTGERRDFCRDCRNKKTSPEVPKMRTLRDRVGDLEDGTIYEDLRLHDKEIVILRDKVASLEETIKILTSKIDEIHKVLEEKSEVRL